MNDFKNNKHQTTNVHLIFDALDQPLNYSWCHYVEYPRMKQYLVNECIDGIWQLRDIRTNKIIMQGSDSLERYLK